MGESVHKNRISSIHQSLDPVYAHFQEKHGSVRLLQHLIFPLKKCKIDITKYSANDSGLVDTNPDIFQTACRIFFSHQSAFCAHETSESVYWSAWNSCKKYAASKIPGLVLTGSQSVINQPLMVEWEWIRHFCGLLTVSGWRRSPKWPERYASPSLPDWSKGSVEPLPLPPPPILFEGRGSSVHRLRPKKTVFVKCREEYHTLSVERPWHWRVRRQFTLFIV